MSKAYRYILLLACVICCTLAGCAAGMNMQNNVETLATIPINLLDNVVIHPRLSIVVYPLPSGTQWNLMRNGKVLGRFDDILTDRFQFNKTGGIATGIVRMDGKYAVVVNDSVIGQTYDAIQQGTPLLGKINGGVIFVSRDGQQWYYVYKDRLNKVGYGKPYARILPQSIRFAPDGFTWAYNARINDKWCVVYMGKEDPLFDEVTPVVFSLDGKHRIYTARTGDKWQLVIDGRVDRSYEAIGPLLVAPPVIYHNVGDYFSAIVYFSVKYHGKWSMLKHDFLLAMNGTISRFGCVGVEVYGPGGEKWAFFPNGRGGDLDNYAGKQYDEIGVMLLSPDTARIVYTATEGNAWILVEGETAGPAYEALGTPLFSADSKHLLCPVKSTGKWRLILDGTSLGTFAADELGTPLFSTDGKHVVCPARSGGRWTLLYDGQPLGAPVEELGVPVFSPVGTHVAVAARSGQLWTMMTDGVAGPNYAAVGTPSWSLSSGHVAYPVRKGNAWYAVINGQEGPAFSSIPHSILFSAEYEKLQLPAKLGVSITPEQWEYLATRPSAQAGAVDFVNVHTVISY